MLEQVARRSVERSSMRRVVAMTACVLALALGARVARADSVDDLIDDLKTGSDYKVRLSAALSLVKLGDQRAIPGFIYALSDSDKTVRGAAVVGLGKLVDADTPKGQRDQVVNALKRMLGKESSDSVKKQAQKVIDIVTAIDASSAPTGGGSVYVDIGAMASKAEPAGPLKDLMRKTTQKAFSSKAKDMMQAWPGGKSPTRKDLDAKKVGGYHVDGTLTEVGVKEKGSGSMVSCKVSMLIATFPEKSVFGFLSGGASVTASNDKKDIALATQDCLTAVVEDLVVKKIIPTIKVKAGL